MLKANEAWVIAKKHDIYAEQLAQIEVRIRNEAGCGKIGTWWNCENMVDYEQRLLAERLEEFGYITSINDGVIYIYWRDADKE